ncbi:MAG: hypothetical protein ACI8ZN_001480 [Bacteroidia bacterium]|jgi:hypothetical protein
MKNKIKSILIVMLLSLFMPAFAQQYAFSVSTGTYANLTNATSLNADSTWDDPLYAVPIGFPFKLFYHTITTLHFDPYGYGAEMSTSDGEVGVQSILIVYGTDLLDRGYDINLDESEQGKSKSPISYVVEGSSGSRIFKLEWQSAGFYGEADENGTQNDFANFQLWFYEGSNNIEIHFGSSKITDPFNTFYNGEGPHVALYPEYNYDLEEINKDGIVLRGNSSDPTVIYSKEPYVDYLSSTPPDGTIYTFTRASVGVEETNNRMFDLTLYPNPSKHSLNVETTLQSTDIQQVVIQDVNGLVIYDNVQLERKINVESFASGMYFLQVTANNGSVVTKKFVKH